MFRKVLALSLFCHAVRTGAQVDQSLTPDYFYISSSVVSGVKKLCLAPSELKNGAKIILEECKDSDKHKWSIDKFGRYKSKKTPWRCLARYKNLLTINLCRKKSITSFSYDFFDRSLIWKRNGNVEHVVTFDDAPVHGLKVKILKRNKGNDDEKQIWHFTAQAQGDAVIANKSSYANNETIVVEFSTSSLDDNTWIGIYPAGTDPNSIPAGSTMFVYAACGKKTCNKSSSYGRVEFSHESDHGNSAWPLCGGKWQAFLIQTITSPYKALDSTDIFTVDNGVCGSKCSLATSDVSSLEHAVPIDGMPLKNLAFSSCYKPDTHNSSLLWNHMRNFEAHVWSWLGDNTYSDGESMEYKRTKYNEGKENYFYQTYGPIAEPKIPVTGTWDDHDYGNNNQGKEYDCRKLSQDEFANFFNIPETDARHPNNPNQQKGVYSSNIFTQSRSGGDVGVHLIHVDARYHRSPTFDKYGQCEGADSTILGSEQWSWLQSELDRKSEIKVIGSGIQVLPPTYRDGKNLKDYCAYDGEGGTFDAANTVVGEGLNWKGLEYECWSEIPQERTKLLQMAQKSINNGNAKRIIFISGDQHWGEIMAKKMPAHDVFGDSQILYEVTASGIDQNYPYDNYNSNRVRIRSADNQDDGIFLNECKFPFNYNGNTYTDCTMTTKRAWCATNTDENDNYIGSWGYCASPTAELVPKENISFSNKYTCFNYLHICSAESNYGGISVDWVNKKITLAVFTPHDKDDTVAASISIDF